MDELGLPRYFVLQQSYSMLFMANLLQLGEFYGLWYIELPSGELT